MATALGNLSLNLSSHTYIHAPKTPPNKFNIMILLLLFAVIYFTNLSAYFYNMVK